jgi:hypothetical protein
MLNEIVPGAPFPVRQQTANELEKLARHNPAEAAHKRIVSDFQRSLTILSLHYAAALEIAEADGDIDLI